MRQWYQEQLSRIEAFRTFLVVFFILHKPSLQRPRLKDLSAAFFILLGFFQLGQAMRHLVVRPVITRPILSLSSRQAQTPPPAPPAVTPKEFYRAREGSTRPVMQWKNAGQTREISVEGDQVIEEVIKKEEAVPAEPPKPLKQESSGWRWPASYGKMLISFLSLIGFSFGAASLLAKGNAPSLLRFANCLILVSLFASELYHFMDAPVYATEIQLFGVTLLLASAGLLVKGCSLSYMDREYVL